MVAKERSLVGRERELDELLRLAEEAAAGRGTLVFLIGASGIGKTRLADAFAEARAAGGFATHWGRCWELGDAPPYWPWVQALRSLAQRRGTAAPGLDRLAAPEERFERFDAVASYLLAGAAPEVVILDDLHAADQASLALLAFVARQLARSRLLVVGTFRDLDADLHDDTRQWLARAARDAEVVALAPLGREAIGDLVTARAASVSAELVDLVARESEGNPLFAHELLSVLDPRAPGAPRAVPRGIRAVIDQHLAHVGAEVRALLEVAAVLGREISAAAVAGAAGEPLERTIARLGEAVRVRLLTAVGPGAYRFAHALLGETLLHELAPDRRAALHLRAAETVERLHRGDPRIPLADLARHWLAAGPAHAARALEASLQAGEAQLRQLAFEDAARQFAQASEALAVAAPGDAARAADLLLRRAVACFRGGLGDAGREACQRAAELARSLASPELLGRAALTYGSEMRPGVVDPILVGLLDEAIAALPAEGGPAHARLLARRAAALQPAADPATPVELARRAIAMTPPEDPGRLEVLVSAGAALMDFVDAAERRPLSLELVERARKAGERALVYRGQLRQVFDALELADLAAVDQALGDLEATANAFRQPRYRWPPALLASMRALLEGRFADGEAHVARAREILRSDRDPDALRCLALHRFGTAWIRHEGEAEAFDPQVVAAVLTRAPAALAEAAVSLRGGRLPEAQAALARTSPELILANAGLGIAASFACEVTYALRRRDLAEPLLERLAGRADRLWSWGMISAISDGPVARGLLLLAATLERWEEADRHAAEAIALAEREGLRPHAARVRVDHAEVLARQPGADAEARARARLAEARPLLETLALPGLARRAAAIEARLGQPGPAAQPSARSARVPAATGPAPPAPADAPVTIELEGETWLIQGRGASVRLKDSRGLRLLARLLENPDREQHVLELWGGGDTPVDRGDAGEMVDAEARGAYKARLADLEEILAEAEARNDRAQVDRIREERDFLVAELARAFGLGGRERRAGSPAERARINVQRRLADALKRIGAGAPTLGVYLGKSIRTGTFCAYVPVRS